MRRFLAPVFGFVFFVIPIFPAFITLTIVTVPGVSLLPVPATLAVLAMTGVMAVYVLIVNCLPSSEPVPMLVPLLAWWGSCVLSLTLGFDPLGGVLFVTILGLNVVWHVTVVRYYRSANFALTVYRAYLLSGALAALAAVLMVLTKMPAAQYTVGHGRAIGTFILPGELAAYLIIYLPLAFAIARVTKRADLRILAVAGLATGTLAFVMTFSRAGWVGLAAAIAFLALTQMRRWRRRSAVAILLAAVAGVFLVFNLHHNPSENFTRLSIWQAAIEMFARFPLLGVGPFAFERVYPFVRLPDGEPTAFHGHSYLLTFAAETGVIGLSAVAYMWGRFALLLRERIRTANPVNASLALAVAAGLLGTWVQGMIDTVTVVIFALWMPFMAIALCCAQDGLVE